MKMILMIILKKMKIIMFYIELLLFFMVTISLQVVCRWKHILLKIMEKVLLLRILFIFLIDFTEPMYPEILPRVEVVSDFLL